MPRRAKKARLTKAQLNQVVRYVEHPPELWGRDYVRRDTAPGLAKFGASYKEASAQQRLDRRKSGYTGAGAYYGGRGGFFNDQWSKVKAAGTRLGSMAVDRGLGMAESYASQFLSGRGAYSSNALVDGGASGSGFVRTVPEFGPNPDDQPWSRRSIPVPRSSASPA